MRKLFFVLQVCLFVAFNFTLLLTVYQLAGTSQSFIQRMTFERPVYSFKEEFDSSLKTINTVQKLVTFCDGLYMQKASTDTSINFGKTYPEIVSSVIQKRFYHGYSTYGFSNNYMAKMLSVITVEGLSAIVVPDDILKYSKAACSQQSIVFMEALKEKGFSTRMIGFKGNKNGHFCFEVYYNGEWHFYDPDMEPNTKVISEYNRPNVEFLASHKDILVKAYAQHPPAQVLDLFSNYFYGSVNTFPAPKAMVFQKISQILSYSLWLVFLVAFIWTRKKYKKLKIAVSKINNQEFVAPIQMPAPSIYYPA